MAQLPRKDHLKGTSKTPFCEKWHPPECLFYKSETGCRFGEKCSYADRQVDEQPSKKSKKNGHKSAVAILKNTRQFVLPMSGYGAAEVFIDFAEELKHTEATPMCSIHKSRGTSCYHPRPKPHRLDIFAQANLISAAPTLQNLRIGLKKRRSGKSKVPAKQRGSWPKPVLKLKEHERATFFSSSENRCLPASTRKPEEREFVVDSGASMHMISKRI